MYCREACRFWAIREQKAKYQQKRRKLINDGELTVKRELKRIGVKT